MQDSDSDIEGIQELSVELSRLRSEGFTWDSIAIELQIQTDKLGRWRKKVNFEDVCRNVESYPQKLLDQMRSGVFSPEDLPHEMTKLLDEYKNLFLSWKQFAIAESVNIDWLRSWRVRYDYDDLYDDLDDDELDDFVTNCMIDHPERGEVMVGGCLRAAGLNIPRQRLRDSLNRVDPHGREERKRGTVQRRVYSVPGPHHLWHMDGYHKLNKFHLVIHAAVDGFTRLCTFARCNDNNEAATVKQDFLVGVEEFGCPSRIRTDKGGENVEVGIWMCMQRGLGRGSIIMGKSTHNQRIERFWKDVKKEVTSYYVAVFTHLEEDRGVDFLLESHIFCIHYLFLPRINEELKLFQSRWNHHKIRTEQNKSPLQLQFLHQHVNAAIPFIDVAIIDELTYGLDGDHSDDDDFRHEDEEHGRPRISSISSPLSEAGFHYFSFHIRPLTLQDDNVSLFFQHFQAAIYQFDIAIQL